MFSSALRALKRTNQPPPQQQAPGTPPHPTQTTLPTQTLTRQGFPTGSSHTSRTVTRQGGPSQMGMAPSRPSQTLASQVSGGPWQSVWVGAFKTDSFVTSLVNVQHRRKPVKMKVLYTAQEGYYFLKHPQMRGGFGSFFVGHAMGTGEQIGVKEVALRAPKNP